MDDSLCGAQAQYFSNAFSNAGDYVRLRLDVREMKARYSKRLWSSANVSKLKQAAWHVRTKTLPNKQNIYRGTGIFNNFEDYLVCPDGRLSASRTSFSGTGTSHFNWTKESSGMKSTLRTNKS
jgi:hypothetical protein